MAKLALQQTPLRIWLCEAFALGNLAFLAVDIFIAHSINEFAHWAEWVPLCFSVIAPAFLLPGVVRRQHEKGFPRIAGLGVGGASVLLGVAGLLLHLDGAFFQTQTLKSLVYTAPFAAPLSYTGIGLLLILNRLEPFGSRAWGPWVVFLAMWGFVGNLVLSLLDHAQNGFFVRSEWIAVIGAAFGVSFLFTAVVRGGGPAFLKGCVLVMVLEIVGSVGGFALHFFANLEGPAESLATNMIYGAPIFAPFLFADLAILALVGLWEMMKTGDAMEYLDTT